MAFGFEYDEDESYIVFTCDSCGKILRYEPYLSAQGERATSGTGEERAEVHILCTDWLDPYAYRAIYNMPTWR